MFKIVFTEFSVVNGALVTVHDSDRRLLIHGYYFTGGTGALPTVTDQHSRCKVYYRVTGYLSPNTLWHHELDRCQYCT